jgi:hypothetical protein
MYPMMPHPIGVPPGFPPYNMGPFMNPGQPYGYNMVGMPMQQQMSQSMQQQNMQQPMQQPKQQSMQQPMQQPMSMQQSMQSMPQPMQQSMQSMQQPMQQSMQQPMRLMNAQIYPQGNGGNYQMNTKPRNYNNNNT